jgi:hypothetical protein
MLTLQDVTVVVRSAGERTTEACVALLKEIFPPENVSLLNSVPFSKAIADSWEVGRVQKRPWLLCIDADVLVSLKGVKHLLERASALEENVFEIQGLVLDKFIPVLRPAGNHLYRVSLTDKAYQLIPSEGTSLRPESDMLNRMTTAGHPWVQCDAVVGLHDFEQFNADIYRKCFLQAHKHKSLLNEVEPYWISEAVQDMDFKIALMAVLSGKLHSGTILIDKRFLNEEIEKTLSILSIAEKSKFILTDGMLNEVEKTLKELYAKISPDLQDSIFPSSKWNNTKGEGRKARQGIMSSSFNKLGNLFIKAGKKLKS